MKKMLALLILFTTIDTYADWMPYSTNEAIEAAKIIVIAKYTKELKHQELTKYGKRQLVEFRTIKLLKGIIPDKFAFEGTEINVCLPQVYFEPTNINETYILFLSKGNYFAGIPLKIKNYTIYSTITDFAIQFDPQLYNTSAIEMTIQKLKKFSL